MFCIVHFTDPSDNSVQIVPEIWLDATRKFCYWPAGPKANKIASKLISQLAAPQENWQLHPIQLKRSNVRDLKEGKALEKRAEEESNLESSSDHSGGTSSRKRKIFERKISIKKNKGNEVSLEEEDNLRLSPALPSDEDEGPTDHGSFLESTTVTTPPESVPVNSQIFSPPGESQVIEISVFQTEEDFIVNNSADGDLGQESEEGKLPPGTTLLTLYTRQIALEKYLLTTVRELKDDIQELLIRTKSTSTRVQLNVPVKLPLESLTDMRSLEHWMADNNHKTSLVDMFSSFGGKTPQKVVTGILQRLFSKELAVQTNYIGVHNKICFKSSPLAAAVLDGALENPVCRASKTSEIVAFIQTWLQNSRPPKSQQSPDNNSS
ncbi:uncharacterized protein LOC118437193 isoform X1 [Folsomia candida]|uniref:DUF4806 domain-containing protein n=2 Tax=Folsomia candida TaxID=158441 RepID=A0A226DSL4_FOLCA|nr:uncharacterized protein LOC118437193 isoform X1 [Folsomia candida]OXA48209.1 hypothetical protein Fcan01_16975 [Folsomia candida]